MLNIKPYWLAKRAIEKIENFKVSPFILTLYLASLITLRELSEQLFFEESFNIYQFAHHFFIFVLLLSGILIISLVGKIAIIKVTKIVSLGFFIILLPPLIDRFIFLRDFPYEYVQPGNFLKNFATFYFLTPNAGYGIMIEIACILLMAFIYVWIRSHSFRRALLTSFLLYCLAAAAGSPRLFLPLPDAYDLIIFQSHHLIYFFLYFLLCMIIGMIFIYRIDKIFPYAIFKELLSFRTVHFILIVNTGIYFNPGLRYFYFPDIIYIFISSILLVFLWLSTVLINNVYDLEIDRISNPNRPLVKGEISPSLYIGFSSVFSILCLLLSLILGVIPFILSFLSILSSLAYSAPPLRLRRRIFSSVFIGWGSCSAFYIGYFSRSKLGELSLPNDMIVTGLLILVCLSIGPLTKDLKDFEGDRQAGVRTLFTVFGLEKGLKIVASLLCLSLLLPLFLFNAGIDIMIIGISAFLFSLLFYIKKNLVFAFLGYGAVFSYCAARVLELL